MVTGATLATDKYGNPDSAYSFDGVDDHISIPHSDDLNPAPQFSFTCRVNVEPLSSSIDILLDTRASSSLYRKMITPQDLTKYMKG